MSASVPTVPMPEEGISARKRAEKTPPLSQVSQFLSFTVLSGLAVRARRDSTSSEALDTCRWSTRHLASIGRCAFGDRVAFALATLVLCSCCWPPLSGVLLWAGRNRLGPPGLLVTGRWFGTSRRCRRAEPRTRSPDWSAATAPPGFRSRVPALPPRPVRRDRPAR